MCVYTHTHTHTHTHTLHYLALAMMIFAVLVCSPEGNAIAQKYNSINMGGAVLVFATTDQGAEFDVSIAPGGFVFDGNRTQYYPTIPSVASANDITPTNWAGYAVLGGSCSSQDYTMKDDVACGKYKITISEQDCVTEEFTIDFTDYNWLTGTANKYGIVCYLEKSGSQILVYATVGPRTPNTDQEEYGYFLEDDLRYWDMIRSAVSADPTYLRDRNGFTLPTGNYPVGVNDATLDVNATITTTGGSGYDIVVGSGKTFRVMNDPWEWYLDPDGWYTTLKFNSGTGFVVSGGSFYSAVYTGMVYWEANGSTWDGISASTYGTVLLLAGSITGVQGTGLVLNNCNAGNVNVEGYFIENSSGYGVQINSSYANFVVCEFAGSGYSGAYISSYSSVHFDQCYFSGNGNAGAYVGGGNVLMEDCLIADNAQHGIYLPQNSGSQVRVKGCRIGDHSAGYGIYLQDIGSTGFVELQNSCVYRNEVGLFLYGESLLRGWHKTLHSGYECNEQDVVGMNMISENGSNIHADGDCQIDLGREYTNGGTVCTLGGQNDIVSPTTWQVNLDNGADASLVQSYWGADYSFNVNGGATLITDPEIWSSSGACQESAPSQSVEQLPDGLRELVELTGIVLDPNRSAIAQIAKALKAHTTLEVTETREPVSPSDPVLLTASPNPFSSGTTFHFSLPTEETLTLRVFDVLGRQVALVAQGRYATGGHDLAFEAGELLPGVYTAVLHSAARVVSTTRFVLSR